MTLRIDINTTGVVRAEKTIDRSTKSMSSDFEKVDKSINLLESSIKDLQSTFNKNSTKMTSDVKKFSKTTQSELKKSGHAFGGFLKTVKAAALGYATVLATMEIQEFVTNTVKAGVEIDSLRRSFEAITGSETAAAQEMAFVDKTAKDLGLSLGVLRNSYKDILAASKGTSLEGENVQRVFLAINKASAVLGMTSDDTTGALRALSQMISKGNVQAEELRGWSKIGPYLLNCGNILLSKIFLLLGLDYRTKMCYS